MPIIANGDLVQPRVIRVRGRTSKATFIMVINGMLRYRSTISPCSQNSVILLKFNSVTDITLTGTSVATIRDGPMIFIVLTIIFVVFRITRIQYLHRTDT